MNLNTVQDQLSDETSGEYVLFEAGDLLCGLRTRDVQEIIRYNDITVVRLAPSYVRGVINLRGEIVTIIDLRKKFGLPAKPLNKEMQIIIVRKREEHIGLLVERVIDAFYADSHEIEPPPSNLGKAEGDYFEGVYKMQDNLAALLCLRKILEK